MSDLTPDQIPGRWDDVVENYETIFEPATAEFAEEALRLADLKPGERVLDVAAGPGVLAIAAAKKGMDVAAIDFSQVMVERLSARAKGEGLSDLSAQVMDGQALDFPDQSFDAVFSNFGLIFFADRTKGFQQMHRVLKPGGRTVVSAWGAPEKMQALQVLMGALRKGVPEVPPPPRPPVWLSLADPKNLEAEMRDAGFGSVDVHTLTRTWTTPSPKRLWNNLRGVSPGVAFIFDILTDDQVDAMGKAFVGILHDRFGEGAVRLDAEAHIAVGKK